jgi:hypothetical protein
MFRVIIASAIACGVALCLVAFRIVEVPAAADSQQTAAIAGSWSGEAQIFVNWTAQRTLAVRVSIAPDGRVSGTVGDAVLRNGNLHRNRGALGRALHVKTDWAVTGDLEGDMIKAEAIRRTSVTIPLDWSGDHFEGGVNTSGTHFGGKASMWLAAGRLRLERVPDR